MIQKTACAHHGLRIEARLFEHYRALADRVRQFHVAGQTGAQTIGITSCSAGEGVSTVSVNLATTAATVYHQRVLLVDSNLAQPSLRGRFRLSQGPGLADVLVGSLPVEQVVQASPEPNLSLLPAGTDVSRRRACFDPAHVGKLMGELKANYDLVLVDLPAATQTSTCWGIAGALDGVLLVVEAESVSRQTAQQVKRQLMGVGANPLGVVFNKQREHVPVWLNHR